MNECPPINTIRFIIIGSKSFAYSVPNIFFIVVNTWEHTPSNMCTGGFGKKLMLAE